MADVSPGGGHGAPLQPLPAWLSRTSFPTATVDLPYTIATLLPNGVPTLIITAQRVTQYGTDILQLPLTVDPGADVSGQNLGDLYTTAGGDATQTVVRELGGTRMFTLGRESGTQALAGGTAAEGQSAPAAGTAMSAAEPPAASGGAPPASAYPPSAAQSPSPISASQQPSPAPTASVASVAASLSAALASATGDSTPDPASVASLSSAYASATSALSAASPSSASSTFPTSAPPSSLPSTPPSVSSSTSSSPSPSSTSSPALNPTHHLTPSQLAAAIAAPLAFLLLLLLLFICCFTPSRFVPSEVPYSDAHYAPPVPLTYAEGLSVPLGPVRQATSTLSQLWQGYETNSPRTDAGDEGRKRESSRLGYLSWSTLDGGGGGQQQEYTPPHTPELPALRVIHEREDDERSYSGSSEGERRTQGRQAVVSEGGWLSGRLSGLFPSTRPSRDTLYEADEEDDGADEGDRLRVPLGVERRGSGDTGGSGQSDEFRGLTGGDLFLNSPRWIGTRRRRSSPPPFSSFEPLGSTSISYDPPIILHHQASSTSLDPPYRQPRHWSSFATETESRYHDADSPIFAPTPAESPGLYPSSSQLPRVTTVVKGRHQREDSGVSVLGRIAASFGALKGGVAAGLGIDGEGAGAGAGVTRRRGMPRRREFSTESSMDPFQYSYATANLPTVPSPTSSPRKQRTRRSLTALRHSQSQPMMQKPSSNAPPLPFPSARPLSTVVGRYHDPFADADVDGGADDERAVQQRAHQERREYEYGQEREGPDMGEIRRVGEQSE
ncbi:Proteophosphoglycan 5 [Rhodotorula toruloides ATCC 204091]|nr:Proteophosphoglycan 5 [Rhodotorula toruloides ATCC 204091]